MWPLANHFVKSFISFSSLVMQGGNFLLVINTLNDNLFTLFLFLFLFWFFPAPQYGFKFKFLYIFSWIVLNVLLAVHVLFNLPSSQFNWQTTGRVYEQSCLFVIDEFGSIKIHFLIASTSSSAEIKICLNYPLIKWCPHLVYSKYNSNWIYLLHKIMRNEWLVLYLPRTITKSSQSM